MLIQDQISQDARWMSKAEAEEEFEALFAKTGIDIIVRQNELAMAQLLQDLKFYEEEDAA